MATYNGGNANPRGETTGNGTTPQQPATAVEPEALESARREAVAAQVEVPEEPDAPRSGKRVLITCVVILLAYLCVGVIAYTSLAGMDFVDALYFCIGKRTYICICILSVLYGALGHVILLPVRVPLITFGWLGQVCVRARLAMSVAIASVRGCARASWAHCLLRTARNS